MKLCQKCIDEIYVYHSRDHTIMPIPLHYDPPITKESDCEFWAHKALNESHDITHRSELPKENYADYEGMVSHDKEPSRR